MSLLASMDAFQKAFVDDKKTFTEEFIVELRTYLKTKNRKRHRMLLEKKKKNEPISSFQVRGDVVDDLCTEFLIREVPFVLIMNMMGEYGIIIRDSDRNNVINIINVILKRKSKYMRVMTGAELINYVTENEKDKNLVAVNDLTLAELRMLEEMCRSHGDLTEVSEDLMSNGKYRFMIPAKKAALTNNFATALFEMNVMSSGSNKEINLRRTQNTINFQDVRFNNFGRAAGLAGALYVVGNSNQYLKIEQESFEYGHAALKDGYVRLIPQVYKDMSEMGFKEYEDSYLNRITQPAITKDIGQVTEHFNNMLKRTDERDSLNFGYTTDEKNTHFGEKTLIRAITDVVMRKVDHDDIMNISGKELHKIGYVTNEIGSVLNGLIEGEIPRGYDRADFAEIMSRITEYAGGSVNPGNYKEVADKMGNMVLTNERGTIEIDKYLSGYIEKLRMEREEHSTDEKETEIDDMERG